ncbi:Crp/Fnr family transcriptional regulator [Pseudoduganella danionis]|uniref:Crp/Fnr family transcriptional regulator n=1 Tax=Pseudoduganella danionis TaxID=1890295 RepID=UPI0035B425A1
MANSIEQNNCSVCSQRTQCVGAAAGSQTTSHRIRIERHTALYEAGSAVGDQIYHIRSGSFKVVRGPSAPDADAHVIGFALAPDFIGLDALDQLEYSNSVVALEDSVVCSISWNRHAFEGRRRPVMRAHLHALLAREMRREQRAALMLRNTQAEQRMADLLLTLSERQTTYGYQPEEFRLPMSRCDIASYLGVTAECVSRLLLQFKQRALFELCRRDVKLLDMSALRTMAFGHEPHPQQAMLAAA